MRYFIDTLPNGGFVLSDVSKDIGAYSNAADMMDSLWELVKPDDIPEASEEQFAQMRLETPAERLAKFLAGKEIVKVEEVSLVPKGYEPGEFIAILRNEERIKKADQDKLDSLQMAVFGKLCDCPTCTAARKMQ
jgi:hypothetical protein